MRAVSAQDRSDSQRKAFMVCCAGQYSSIRAWLGTVMDIFLLPRSYIAATSLCVSRGHPLERRVVTGYPLTGNLHHKVQVVHQEVKFYRLLYKCLKCTKMPKMTKILEFCLFLNQRLAISGMLAGSGSSHISDYGRICLCFVIGVLLFEKVQ
jgi:hypothetical protein